MKKIISLLVFFILTFCFCFSQSTYKVIYDPDFYKMQTKVNSALASNSGYYTLGGTNYSGFYSQALFPSVPTFTFVPTYTVVFSTDFQTLIANVNIKLNSDTTLQPVGGLFYNGGYGQALSTKKNSAGGGSASTFTISLNYLAKGTGNSSIPLTNSLIYDNGTNMSVGSTSPVGRFSLLTSNTQLGFAHTNGTITLGTYANSSDGFGEFGTTTNHSLAFLTNNNVKMIVLNNGNVGINTLSPSVKLVVNTSDGDYGISHTDGVNSINTLLDGAGNGYLGMTTSKNLGFFIGAGTNYLTLFSNNNVGIGAMNSADAQLKVKGQDNLNSSFAISTVNASQTNLFAVNNVGAVYFRQSIDLFNPGQMFVGAINCTDIYLGGNNCLDVINSTPVFISQHIQSSGLSSVPTIVAGSGAGTGATVTMGSGSDVSTDMSGVVSITTGTLPSNNSTIATITFDSPYATGNVNVILTPTNALAANPVAGQSIYATSTNSTFSLVSGSTPLTAATTYKWYYHILQ